MINITLPDGSIKPFDKPPSGVEVALSISEGLARETVAMEIDGRLVDATRVIANDATLRLITTRDPEALEVMRHSAAHVMAQAILRLHKEAKLTIGPVVEERLLLRYRHGAGVRGGFPGHRSRDENHRQGQAAYRAAGSPQTRGHGLLQERALQAGDDRRPGRRHHLLLRAGRVYATCAADRICPIPVSSRPSS